MVVRTHHAAPANAGLHARSCPGGIRFLHCLPDKDHLLEGSDRAHSLPPVTLPHPVLSMPRVGTELGEPRSCACILPARSLGNVAVDAGFHLAMGGGNHVWELSSYR